MSVEVIWANSSIVFNINHFFQLCTGLARLCSKVVQIDNSEGQGDTGGD